MHRREQGDDRHAVQRHRRYQQVPERLGEPDQQTGRADAAGMRRQSQRAAQIGPPAQARQNGGRDKVASGMRRLVHAVDFRCVCRRVSHANHSYVSAGAGGRAAAGPAAP